MASATPIYRQYETVILVRPDATEAGQTAVKSRVAEIVEAGGGKVARWETWGKRRLAYEIGKQNKAYYLYANYVTSRDSVAEIERNLRISEPVLKYQTVRLSDELDVAAFDFEKAGAERTVLYLSPEELATIERNYQRERDWAAGARRYPDDRYDSRDGDKDRAPVDPGPPAAAKPPAPPAAAKPPAPPAAAKPPAAPDAAPPAPAVVESAPEPAAAAPEPEPEPEPAPEAAAAPEPPAAPEPEPEPAAEAAPEPAAEAAPEPEPEPAAEAAPEPEPVPEPVAEAEPATDNAEKKED